MPINPAIYLGSGSRTANDLWLDANVRHLIWLQRFAGQLRNESFEIVDAVEKEMRRAIVDVMRSPVRGSRSAERRLEALVREVVGVRTEAWTRVGELWQTRTVELARLEPRFQAGFIETVLPVEINPAIPSDDAMESLANTRRFLGLTRDEHLALARQADLRRIAGALHRTRLGDAATDAARAVVGTTRRAGRDGVTQLARNNVAAATRTVVNGTANSAREAFNSMNESFIQLEVFIAILDGQTTAICRSYDGDTFKIGYGPFPPLHYFCRSERIASLNGEILGERTAIPVVRRELLREYAADNGLAVPRSRAALPRGHKRLFDEFQTKRLREAIGVQPRKVIFEDWLRRQPASYIDEYMGKTDGLLFREGGLRMKDYVDLEGNELPLYELARRHADAFERVGLDPAKFRKTSA